MDLFEQYEEEFNKKTSIIRDRISKLSDFLGERKKVAIAETERQIDDAKDILSHMESAMKNATRERAKRMDSKTKTYATEISRLERDLQRESLVGGAKPSQRYNDFNDDSFDPNYDHRQTLLTGYQKVEESGSRLQNAHRIASETENIGVDVLGNLHSQRQTLEKARDNLSTIDDNMTKSRKILNSMTRRIATNKLILAIIVVLLLVANGLIIYFKWIKKK